MGRVNLFKRLRKEVTAFRVMASLYWPSLWRSHLEMFILFFLLSIFLGCVFIFLFVNKYLIYVLTNVNVTINFGYFIPPILIVYMAAMILMCGQPIFSNDRFLHRIPRLCNHASSLTVYLLGAGTLAPLLIIQSFIPVREIDKSHIFEESILLQIWALVAVLTVRGQRNIELIGNEPRYFVGRLFNVILVVAFIVISPMLVLLIASFIAEILTIIGLLENGGLELFVLFKKLQDLIEKWISSVKNIRIDGWPVILAASMTLLILRALRLVGYLKRYPDSERIIDRDMIDATLVTIFLIQLCFCIFAIFQFKVGYSIMLINLLFGAISPSISDYFYHNYYQKRL